MKKYLLGIIFVLVLFGAYQMIKKPISTRAELAVVGDTMSQLSMLRGLINKYKENHDQMPETLEDLKELKLTPSQLSSIRFQNLNNKKSIQWEYYPEGLNVLEGRIYVFSPISYDSTSPELSKKPEGVDYRVALFESGKVGLVEESHIESAKAKRP